MKTNSVPQEHLSTMAYLWQQYDCQLRALAFRAQTQDEWRAWRDALCAKLIECLGGFPEERCDLAPRVVAVVEEKEYRREKVYFYSEPGVAVPCSVLIPRKIAPPYRAVIALHGHGSDGARFLLGLTRGDKERAQLREYNYDYARQLARRGFMVFAPVQRALGECVEPNRAYRTQSGVWKKSCGMTAHISLLLGKTLAGLRVWDVMRTIDYLRARPEPIAEKIGCLGLSGGGVITLYASALDERIGAAVIDGAFCTYRASIMSIEHCPDNYVPGILRSAEVSDVAGLIAPRPVLIEHGIKDPIFPIAGVRQAVAELARVYAVLNCPGNLDADYFPGGHRFGGRKAFAWLARWLE
ncbi:MAG: alpha/beta hydrolase family protein [Chloroflexota bacterium]